MARTWNSTYRAELAERFESSLNRAEKSLAPLVAASVTPTLESLAIGESKQIWAVPMFFDVADFTNRVAGLRDDEVSEALVTLHALIPVVMSAVYDFGGYVEKNTGGGIFAVFPEGASAQELVTRALDCSLTVRALVTELVNPLLSKRGIEEIQYRWRWIMGGSPSHEWGFRAAPQISHATFSSRWGLRPTSRQRSKASVRQERRGWATPCVAMPPRLTRGICST